MEKPMTDKQFDTVLLLIADKFDACETMEDVKKAVDEVRKMTEKKSSTK